MYICCDSMKFNMELDILREENGNLFIFNAGYTPINYCPFCGKKIEDEPEGEPTEVPLEYYI